ncbi:hypothetical protein BDD12DRAFT_354068 [Trichophaea hybrida]|nr:hypothetical protein BDD12DRAFT_354068 [Trichophaea hybrida]
MPESTTSSYTSATAKLISTPQSRKPSVAIPRGPHASALPQYGEYIVDSPSITGAPVIASSVPPDQEDYVFYDPVAFRYLEEDPCVFVIDRRRYLYGYEIYLVEQWACSRTHPTFVICTYTGDSSHRITVSVLRIPKDMGFWSKQLSIYFREVTDTARPKETGLGTMMVTNLSSFPSALTVVPIPGGDVKHHRMNFIVNEDLKRIGCSGRSGLSLTTPIDASQTKFQQLFRTSDRINFCDAVVELVRLCQLALVVFEKLKLNYADGLLCDVTEKGIRDWWAEFGTDFYNVEPNDGTLGPTTVAALLGMVLGARNRLSLCGAPVPKDAFEIQQLEKAIVYFQRQQRLDRAGPQVRIGRLDRTTMDRLQQCTMKSGPGTDIFAVPRAIKSTVADLSARAVGSSSGSNDVTAVETVDIERFTRHISGESCKFLWQGKLRKSTSLATTTAHSNTPSRRNSFDARRASLSGDEESSVISGIVSSRAQDFESPTVTSTTGSTGHHFHSLGSSSTFSSVESSRDATTSDLRKNVFKSVTGRMKDVASNISAGADYMRGRGGHQRTFTKDPGFTLGEDGSSISVSQIVYQQQHQPSSRTFPAPVSSSGSAKVEGKVTTAPPSPRMDGGFGGMPMERTTTGNPLTPLVRISPSNEKFPTGIPQPPDSLGVATADASAGSSVESAESVPTKVDPKESMRPIRRKSFNDLQTRRHRHEAFFPNRLSFSLASEAILTWDLPFEPPDSTLLVEPIKQACNEAVEWSETHLSGLQKTLNTQDKNVTQIRSVLAAKSSEVGRAEREGQLVFDTEREKVRDAIREAEVLSARMHYEMGVVQGKLLDLEESIANLGKFVLEVESEVKALDDEEDVEKKRGWFSWIWGR